ncbi:mpv17-like protein 2 [Petaurus breviceps papuanus]|uniref:mpv17-like protein 2 n=1 Tax=Petaurus breviceps papuanus TaxID=3040969 RepID=UPI0036D82A95
MPPPGPRLVVGLLAAWRPLFRGRLLLVTNTLDCGALMAAGDGVRQVWERRLAEGASGSPQPIDLRRTAITKGEKLTGECEPVHGGTCQQFLLPEWRGMGCLQATLPPPPVLCLLNTYWGKWGGGQGAESLLGELRQDSCGPRGKCEAALEAIPHLHTPPKLLSGKWACLSWASWSCVSSPNLHHPSSLAVGLGCLEGQSLEATCQELQDKFWEFYKADWCVWPAAQLVNFLYVPTHYRVMYVNSVTLGWDTYLSYLKHRDRLPSCVGLTSRTKTLGGTEHLAVVSQQAHAGASGTGPGARQ